MNLEVARRMDRLVGRLNALDALYREGRPAVDDQAWDRMYDELVELERQHPNLVRGDSPTRKVGGRAPAGKTVHHDPPMLSLGKALTGDELVRWAEGHRPSRFTITPKLDGVSLELRYVDGRLAEASTRGNGTDGEDVTAAVQLLDRGVPYPNGFTGKVRGEAVIDRKDWKGLREQGGFSSARNLVAGSLGANDPTLAAARHVRFLAYDLLEEKGPSAYGDCLTRLATLGFDTPPRADVSLDELAEATENLFATFSDEVGPDIDGVVVRVVSQARYWEAGATSHHPHGALARKWAAEETVTTLERVTWQVSRNGRLTPVAEVTPVFLSGATIARATLHNLALAEYMDIRVGDKVRLRRSGEVIPTLMGALVEERTALLPAIEAPSECPACHGPVVRDGDSPWCRDRRCPGRLRESLEHFAAKDGMDIDGLGPQIIHALERAGLATKPSDLYGLTAQQLIPLDRMGQKRAQNIVAAIQASKSASLGRFLIALGIPGASKGTSKRLLERFPDLAAIRAATEAELSEVRDVGPITAHAIRVFFDDPAMAEEIDRLVTLGLGQAAAPRAAGGAGALAGMTFVITGAMPSGRKRDEIAALIEAAGGTVGSSVSAKTTYLVTGDPTSQSSKSQAARRLGVEVIGEDALEALLTMAPTATPTSVSPLQASLF